MFSTQPNDSAGQRTQNTTRGKIPATVGLVFLVVLPAILVVKFLRTESPTLPVPGDRVPIQTIRKLDSTPFDKSFLNGRLTAILFFSAECPHCIRELVTFDRLRKRFEDRIGFVAISTSSGSKTAEILRWYQVTVPTLLDRNEEGKKGFGVEIVPAFFLVDSAGVIVYTESGEQSYTAHEKSISSILIHHEAASTAIER